MKIKLRNNNYAIYILRSPFPRQRYKTPCWSSNWIRTSKKPFWFCRQSCYEPRRQIWSCQFVLCSSKKILFRQQSNDRPWRLRPWKFAQRSFDFDRLWQIASESSQAKRWCTFKDLCKTQQKWNASCLFGLTFRKPWR